MPSTTSTASTADTLLPYPRKRDFTRTPVLVSWAAPKGPALDPAVRRAAFRVEDYPIEYIDFERVIPAGGYGGGDVIVWDTGTWQPHRAGDPPDPGRAIADGELHPDLYGEKLRGRFVLVRTRPCFRSGGDRGADLTGPACR
jgi:DNA ligase D-like protein (predicted 3'-phosphoesterase)